jgi:hypothetical protein
VLTGVSVELAASTFSVHDAQTLSLDLLLTPMMEALIAAETSVTFTIWRGFM